MCALLDDKKIIGPAESFPNFGKLRGKQFAKDRTDADVREIIAGSSDCSPIAGIITVLGMIKGLLHEPGEGLRALLLDLAANQVTKLSVQSENVQRPTPNVQR